MTGYVGSNSSRENWEEKFTKGLNVSKVEIKFALKFLFSSVKYQKGEKVVTSGVDLFGLNNFVTGGIRN